MVSELLCLQIARCLHGRTSVFSRTFNLEDNAPPKTERSEEKNSLTEASLIRPLLAEHDLADIEAAIRWLQLGEYLGRTQWGLGGPWVHVLTPKGVELCERGGFPEQERRLFYHEEPHQVFLAHQFRSEDEGLESALRATLSDAGYVVVDGQVDGLEQFRQAIFAKIKRSRFFVCLLTQRARLEAGGAVSSVWLYQEIGAAVALKKSPLLFVEDGMDPHFAGELQKTYEYVPFTRGSASPQWCKAVSRLNTDLAREGIPLPKGKAE